LATLGQRVGVDLWNFQTRDGRSIRKALDFLTPVAVGKQKWAYQEIEGGVKPESLFPLMRRAAQVYHDQPYQILFGNVPEVNSSDRRRLLQPDLKMAKPAQQ
jgi:hypothetical protein